MVTTVGTESDLVTLLTDLVQLDFDAVDAYQAAIDRLDNPEWRATLASFRDDHLRHTAELGEALRGMGIVPPSGGDIKSMLTQGKVVMAGLVGDEAVLRAMRTNEADTNTAYERAVQFPDLHSGIRDMLEAGLADERRHCAWILSQIE
jgi:rubrerythrin